MAIIDCRYRPSTRETMDSFLTNPVYSHYIKLTDFPTRPVKPLDACIRELGELGIRKAVVAGRDCESTYAAPHSNDEVLACMRRAPDLFIGLFGFDPHKGMDGVRAFRAAVETHGMRGAAIDPCMAQYRVCDARYYPLYAMCCDYSVPVFITAGLSPFMPGVVLDPMDPRYVDMVARDFPELRILISHGGYPWVNEAIAVTMRNRNVYIDFSTCERKLFGEFYVKAANDYIADKVVFSSANPFVQVAHAVRTYQELNFTPEAREKLFHTNACTLLGIAMA